MLRRLTNNVYTLESKASPPFDRLHCQVDLPSIDMAVEALSASFPPNVILNMKRPPCETLLQYEYRGSPAFASLSYTQCISRARSVGNSRLKVTLHYTGAGNRGKHPGYLRGDWFSFSAAALQALPYLRVLKGYLGTDVLLSYNVRKHTFHAEFVRADSSFPFLHYEFQEGKMTEIDDSFRL
jgi:hypothetical protein